MHDGRKNPTEESIFPLPLVIGVTGHRELREEDRVPLAAAVRKVLDELKSICPHTPLLLLSSLAEGADRLVAEVALEKEIRARLIVPLPMEQTLYEQDFKTEASREEFRSLLQQAEQCFDLSSLYKKAQKGHDYQYRRAGQYIALHCQLLIALWDGNDTNRIGGTSEIMSYQLEGISEKDWLLHLKGKNELTLKGMLEKGWFLHFLKGISEKDWLLHLKGKGKNATDKPQQNPLGAPENGWACKIVTPQLHDPVPLEQPFTPTWLCPGTKIGSETDMLHNEERASDEDLSTEASRLWRKLLTRLSFRGKPKTTPQELKSALQSLDTFNKDAEDKYSQTAQESSKLQLSEGLETFPLSNTEMRMLTCYARLYAIADVLAIHFKKRTGWTLLFLFALSFIAVIFFAVYAHLTPPVDKPEMKGQHIILLAIYVIFLVIAYIFWHLAIARGHYKNKYLDYRALAEGLRVQFFWRLAGMQEDTVAIHYLREQKGKLDWIRNSIRVANLLYDSPSKDAFSSSVNRYHLILRQWPINQNKYFTHAAVRDKQRLKWNERLVKVCVIFGIAFAVTLLALWLLSLRIHLYPLAIYLPTPTNWLDKGEDPLIVFMTLAFVIAALAEGYADKQAYTEEIEHYQQMSYLFKRASQCFQQFLKQKQLQDAQSLILELGKEALEENGNWVILQHARAIRVPTEA